MSVSDPFSRRKETFNWLLVNWVKCNNVIMWVYHEYVSAVLKLSSVFFFRLYELKVTPILSWARSSDCMNDKVSMTKIMSHIWVIWLQKFVYIISTEIYDQLTGVFFMEMAVQAVIQLQYCSRTQGGALGSINIQEVCMMEKGNWLSSF